MARINGVLFKSKPWVENESDPNRKSSFCLAIGNVTRDAKETCHSKPKVAFGLAYAKKQFINECIAWDGSPFYETAKRLEYGDRVLVAGILSEKDYVNSSGERNTSRELNIGFLVPAAVITDGFGFAQGANPRAAADMMESVGDLSELMDGENPFDSDVPLDL